MNSKQFITDVFPNNEDSYYWAVEIDLKELSDNDTIIWYDINHKVKIIISTKQNEYIGILYIPADDCMDWWMDSLAFIGNMKTILKGINKEIKIQKEAYNHFESSNQEFKKYLYSNENSLQHWIGDESINDVRNPYIEYYKIVNFVNKYYWSWRKKYEEKLMNPKSETFKMFCEDKYF